MVAIRMRSGRMVVELEGGDRDLWYPIAFLVAECGDRGVVEQVTPLAPPVWAAWLRCDAGAFAAGLKALTDADRRVVLADVHSRISSVWPDRYGPQWVLDAVAGALVSDDLACRLMAVGIAARCAEGGADLSVAHDALATTIVDHRSMRKTPHQGQEFRAPGTGGVTVPVGMVAAHAATAAGHAARLSDEPAPWLALLGEALTSRRAAVRAAAARGLGTAASPGTSFSSLATVLERNDRDLMIEAGRGVWDGAGEAVAGDIARWLVGVGFDPAWCAPVGPAFRPLQHHQMSRLSLPGT